MSASSRSASEGSPLSMGMRTGYGSVPVYYHFLRRASQKFPQTLHRTESMCSLGHRALLAFLDVQDLQGLRDFLSSRQLQVDDRDENGTTVLMVAAGRGLNGFLREILARGADVNAEDGDGWSALLFAARGGHTEAIRILLEHGAELEHRDMGGWTALMWASYKGHTEIVAILLDAGADVQTRGNYNLSPLLWASGRGHVGVVKLLVERGAKVNVADKYGTTALVWACRRGNVEIIDILIKAGANVDTAGMYSWTPLLVATQGRHQDCVSRLLAQRVNVNALDKDGLTALAIACREGLQEIANGLLAAGAYVNLQDRAGDTQLIHAVKGGHRGVVESLLKRHADLDVPGKDRKTAIYTAVEKGHTSIVKLLLAANPDLEVQTKDGDTALLRAVRSRSVELVMLLLEKKAKVSAVDRKGDTCLHIAMRARSKAIVEVLLRNPKHSQLLYRPNRAGETPYNIDLHHPKTILAQIYGARRLNTNEDSEGMLGYELYSSALADILSDPGLTMPITVGLYAKWGSGKSFLLAKLKEEMKSFARQWAEPVSGSAWVLVWLGAHLALLGGLCAGLGAQSWTWGGAVALSIILLVYIIHLSLRVASQRYDCYWPYDLNISLGKRLNSLKLILQVIFCHPPGPNASSNPSATPVKFYFAEQTKGAGADGEGAVVHMLGSLYDVIEREYGVISTRLYRAFKPRPVKSSAGWRWRKACCVPHVLLFELGILGVLASAALGVSYFLQPNIGPIGESGMGVALISLGLVLIIGLVAHLHSLARALTALVFSQKRHLLRTLRRGDALTALAQEVNLMSDMVKCLDSFTDQQSRLVGVVDALDSCDVEKIIAMLNAVHQLLSEPSRPFIVLLAVDPHIISKAVEANSRRIFTEGSIGGHDFLRNLVHLPVYLQNSGLRQAQRAQSTALAQRSRNIAEEQEGLTTSVSNRRLSSASEVMASQEKLRPPHRGGSRKLRLSDSVASSIGSNLHRAGQGPQGAGAPQWELSKMLLADDYFSDVNPRSMRRLMNVIYITGRLLKAFHIDFNWYRLCSWVNLTEQWPLRASMIVLHHDLLGDQLDDSSSLRHIYDKVRPQISNLREAAPLLELDRDERKLDAFLVLHKSTLTVADLRVFLPFTINLDPYLRKVLKEDQQALDDDSVTFTPRPQVPWIPQPQFNTSNQYNIPSQTWAGAPRIQTVVPTPPGQCNYGWNEPTVKEIFTAEPVFSLPAEVPPCRLSTLSCSELERLMTMLEELRAVVPVVGPILHQQCINGRVLSHCDLQELKGILGLSFGHWEIFRMFIESLRVMERAPQAPWNCPQIQTREEPLITSTKSHKTNTIEKQVTLEEQTICGALQTLNEEALEDVLTGERIPPPGSTTEAMPPIYNRVGRSAPNTPPHLKREMSILKPSGSLKIGSGKHVSYEESEEPGVKIEVVSEKQGRNGRPASLILSQNDRILQRHTGRSHSVDEGHMDLASDDESAPLVTPTPTPKMYQETE